MSSNTDKVNAKQCGCCKKGPNNGAQKLSLCSGCKSIMYCSRECQKADWKIHKNTCSSKGESAKKGNSNASKISPLDYYRTVMPKSEAATKLMEEIGLSFPAQGGISLPLRRLVITGKDTADNIKLLFGPTAPNSVDRIHKNLRIEVLLDPPRGSPMHFTTLIEDKDIESLTRKPCKPSTSELDHISKVRAMQSSIKRHMGERDMSSHSNSDMVPVLTQNYGGSWPEGVPYYQDAINAMDQGVSDPSSR